MAWYIILELDIITIIMQQYYIMQLGEFRLIL